MLKQGKQNKHTVKAIIRMEVDSSRWEVAEMGFHYPIVLMASQSFVRSYLCSDKKWKWIA